MKVTAVFALCAIGASVNALTSPKPAAGSATTTKDTWQQQAASVALASAVLFSSPLLASAASFFDHEYADPFHPLCDRKIQVTGQTFQYTGTAVGPKGDPVNRGCSAAEIKQYGLRQGAFEGKRWSNPEPHKIG